MPTFAANLSTLFTDAPWPERFARAAAAGFGAVEMQFPYELGAEALRGWLDAHGLVMVLHNLPAGDVAAGERGIACHPGREAEFRAAVALGIRYARRLGVRQLNCLAGKAPAGVDDDRLRATLVDNLRWAAAATEAAGIRLLVEPINRRDVPGYWLGGTERAISVIEEVGSDNLFLQYDVYHAQRTEGELAATIERHLARIAHLQIADNPGRREPGSGEINFPFLFRHLARIGYRGHIGVEYFPARRTEETLGWLEEARRLVADGSAAGAAAGPARA